MSFSDYQSVVAIVRTPDHQKFLFIKRRDVPIWALPGGGIDTGETPAEAVVREVKEESGLDVRIVRQTAYYTPLNRLTRPTHAFECEAIGGTPTATDETGDAGFFTLDQLPKPIFFLHLEWLQDAQKNLPEMIMKPIDQVTYWSLFKYFCRHPIQVIRIILSRMGMPLNKKVKVTDDPTI